MLDIPRTSHSPLRPHQIILVYTSINTNVSQDIMPYEKSRSVRECQSESYEHNYIYNVLKTYIGNDSVFLVGQLYSGQWPFA